MNNFLSQHPDIFMAKKELHYFGSDLRVKERISKSDYLAHFKDATSSKIAGEASVWYLFSEKAANEIKSFCPQARIIIMLRDPVEVLHSLHSQHLIDGNEDEADFKTALQLDEQRKLGLSRPNSLEFYELPSYKETVSYAVQVERYLTNFGSENVHVVLHDDLRNDVTKVVDDTITFLGVPPCPHIRYQVVNPRKVLKSLTLHRLMKNPSTRLKKFIRAILPFKVMRHILMKLLFKINIGKKSSLKRDKDFDRELRSVLSSDIQQLSTLINRDLSNWMNSE